MNQNHPDAIRIHSLPHEASSDVVTGRAGQ